MTSPTPSPQPLTPLYISDLDGTLLRADETIDLVKLAKLNQLIKMGLSFTVASARSYVSIKQVANIDLKLPVIELNGAFVSDSVTGEHLLINSLDSAVASQIYSMATSVGFAPFVTSFDGTADYLTYTQSNNLGTDWYVARRTKRKDKRLRQRDKMSQTLKESVVGITAIGDEEAPIRDLCQQVQDTFGNNIIAYVNKNEYSDSYWLMVHDQSASKGKAIKSMQDTFGLNKHELIVFGDAINDAPMFQVADRAYAVENAVDALKEAGTAVIGHHNDGAVIDFILAEQTP